MLKVLFIPTIPSFKQYLFYLLLHHLYTKSSNVIISWCFVLVLFFSDLLMMLQAHKMNFK